MTGLLPLAAAAVSAVLALPNWMAGSWVSENAQEWGEECWTPEHGSTILDASRRNRGLDGSEPMQWTLRKLTP